MIVGIQFPRRSCALYALFLLIEPIVFLKVLVAAAVIRYYKVPVVFCDYVVLFL